MTLKGKNHLKTLVNTAVVLPMIEAKGIKKLGAQHAKPVKKLGNIPIRPLYL
jgi:hypothetical protein